MSEVSKWKKAVVHLECASDSVSEVEKNRIRQKQISGEVLTAQEVNDLAMYRDNRYQGTAVFVQDEDHLYLVTAKHVIFDFRKNSIYSPIFRVFGLDEAARLKAPDQVMHRILMNLGAGVDWMNGFSVSDDSVDLAVIYLNPVIWSGFIADLSTSGFVPITLDDIADEPGEEGSDVFTVGYPASTSRISRWTNLTHPWASSLISHPTFSFGKVAMQSKAIPWFLIDQSIGPGNSGGPVIQNGKMVGIVVRQPLEPVRSLVGQQPIPNPAMGYIGVPFGHATKAANLKQLFDQQKQKIASFDNMIKLATNNLNSIDEGETLSSFQLPE